MAGDTQSKTVWPLPKFYFSVTGLPGGTASFQEVSGLRTEVTPIEYPHGDNPSAYPVKMPSLGNAGNVTLHKGIVINGTALSDWFTQTQINPLAPMTIVIRLLDETAAPTMVWTLNNAYPVKISSTDLKSEGNEVAVESLEIAYETMVVSAP